MNVVARKGPSVESLFLQARGISQFWVPKLLDTLVSLPPTLCDGDGAEIFLKQNDKLYLAATTRRYFKYRLFDSKLSYTMLGLVGLLVGLLVLVLLLFVLLPLIWFFMLAMILSLLVVLSSLPRIRIYYRDARRQRRLQRQDSVRDK